MLQYTEPCRLTIQIQIGTGSRIRIWGLGSKNNKPDKTNGVNNAVSCYKEAVQFDASSVMFASFLRLYILCFPVHLYFIKLYYSSGVRL